MSGLWVGRSLLRRRSVFEDVRPFGGSGRATAQQYGPGSRRCNRRSGAAGPRSSRRSPLVAVMLFSLLPAYATGARRARRRIGTDWFLGLCAGTEVIGGLWLPLSGGLVHAVGWSCLARADHALADMPAVNSLNNLTALSAFVWLGLFSTATLVRVDWFVPGALVIVTANTLLHLDPRGALRPVDQQEHAVRRRQPGQRSDLDERDL